MILPSRYTPRAQPGEPGLAKSLNTSSTAAADFSSEFLLAALLTSHKSRIAANPLATLCQQAIRQLLFGLRRVYPHPFPIVIPPIRTGFQIAFRSRVHSPVHAHCHHPRRQSRHCKLRADLRRPPAHRFRKGPATAPRLRAAPRKRRRPRYLSSRRAGAAGLDVRRRSRDCARRTRRHSFARHGIAPRRANHACSRAFQIPKTRLRPAARHHGGRRRVARRPETLRRAFQPHRYEVMGVPVTGCLHLKSAVTHIGRNTLLANRNWFDTKAFSGFDWIDVAPEEPHAANALALGDTVIFPASFPGTRARLEAAGFHVMPVDISELQKAESGLTCSSLLFE